MRHHTQIFTSMHANCLRASGVASIVIIMVCKITHSKSVMDIDQTWQA